MGHPRRVGHNSEAPRYPGEWTVSTARAAFFAHTGLSEAGYHHRWVRLSVGPIPLWFPNTQGRRRAVGLHDLHHVATEYDTTWTGEAEISAWELGAGCGRHWAAWFLDVGGAALGMVIAPRRTWRAFSRGRRSRSLYHARQLEPEMLHQTVGELRAHLGLDMTLVA